MTIVSEHRSVSLVDAEVKGNLFRGYAAVFDTPWNDRLIEATGYVEKVSRGVFRKALAGGADVPLLLEHDGRKLLGTTGSGNVRLKEDGKGLLTEAKLPDNYLGEYARSMIEAGDLKGMSYGIALDPKRDTIMTRSGNTWTRTIANVQRMLDVSLTWEPAYLATGEGLELRSTGFVATPLQELIGGVESQTDGAASGGTPGDGEAWWGDDDAPGDQAPPAPPADTRPWYDVYCDELEREV